MIYVACFVFFILTGVKESLAGKCDRKIDSGTAPSVHDGKFFITLWTFNKTDTVDQYMPNTRYIVTLEGTKLQHTVSQDSAGYREKFTRFILTADNKNDSSTVEGTFDLIDEMLTQFSDKCPNSVSETSNIPKEEIAVAWTSPPEGSGCILIRATVMETPDTWYMDDGGVARTVCPDPKAIEDDPGPVLPTCCACDEAKYEVTFEGLWSRNTHPKDFPSKGWMIRFSDVIGASHTVDYRFWRYDETASEGLQQVAEIGSTRKLESELKEQSDHIRTIIKARGITHPNVTGKTFAVFRVDRKHHLMSLVSMIVPSPDWIVGVSGLELCLSNCSWIEHKELNLYPIDAGTDDGITYMSPDSSLENPEPIKRITTSWPNDTRSPFYDPLGLDMKPMAKLHLSRQRLYEKSCNASSGDSAVDSGGDNNDINNNNEGSENSTGEEGEGGGEGGGGGGGGGKRHKGKNRKHKHKNKPCRTTQWSAWGKCSEPCGEGKRLRQRKYEDPVAAAAHNCNKSLSSRGTCFGNSPECDGQEREKTILDTPDCKLSEWGEWSSCTTSCGEGETTRSRIFVHKKHRKRCKLVSNGPELQQTVPCENDPCENTKTEEKCPDDVYGPWGAWSPCTSSCGSGTKTRNRIPIDKSAEGGTNWNCRIQYVNCTSKIKSCEITPEDAQEICNEPLITGSCQASFTRVYYNSAAKKCEIFTYKGCDANRNNFHTIEECLKVCNEIQRMGWDKSKIEDASKYKVSISSVLSYHVPVNQEKHRRKSKRERIGPESENFNGIPSGSQVSSITPRYDEDGKVDCQITPWSDWTVCQSCHGYTNSSRSILVQAQNGGKRCPKKLMRKIKCHKILPGCSKTRGDRRKRYHDRRSVLTDQNNRNTSRVDCKLTHWSPWSPCHATCGNAVQHRTRRIKIHPHGLYSKQCTKLVEFRKCSMFPCIAE
ncbi:spondin-1-like isoform X4 [Cotesia glomerata]|uniref:spondin-1-like isoform X4 n=1 Tax=Cotesia glomerata TaxID=32391 RepID=UPI001D00D34F|nr:spondin-1-like isoform X4 [Cotesia glomerata]